MGLRIEWDEHNKTITVGKWKEDKWKPYQTSIGTTPAWKIWVKEVAEDNGVFFYEGHPKKFNKVAADFLGISPTKAYSHYRKLAYKHFVAPYIKYLAKVNYKPGNIDAKALLCICKNISVVQQTYEDGLHNILPIVAWKGKSPAELKSQFKGSWKVIAKNSNNKNKYLAKLDDDDIVDACNLPTSLLKGINSIYQVDTAALKHLAMHYKGQWNNKKKMQEASRLFLDTKLMANQLGLVVDARWTPRRLKEEHDRMFAELNAKRYPKTPFEVTKNIRVKELKVGEYTAHILESAFDIAEEGNAMGHCVAGYSRLVSEGRYLVYSIKKGDERSSTLGVTIKDWEADKKPYYMKNQHYGKYNRRVTDEVEASIPNKILDLLNKKEVE
jgi:hypothetical protein